MSAFRFLWNWATLTLFPRDVFHVHGLKRPNNVIFSPWNATFIWGTSPKNIYSILPPGTRFLPGDCPLNSDWASFGLVASGRVLLWKPGNPGLVVLTTNSLKVKVMSKVTTTLKLGSICCAVVCNISHTLIYLWWPATISKLTATIMLDFPKGFDFVE